MFRCIQGLKPELSLLSNGVILSVPTCLQLVMIGRRAMAVAGIKTFFGAIVKHPFTPHLALK